MNDATTRDSGVRRVLFVCLGNICRSPTAEGILNHVAADRGLESLVQADSAGTISYHNGSPADPRMRAAAASRGYELTSISRLFLEEDFERFDLIVAMDRSNLSDIRSLADGPCEHVKLFSDFLPADFPTDVPDPYLGEAGFDRALDIIEEGCPAILDHLLPED
ncbi:MAG: low molecular weight protein-tyrosine-phosphatase [Acidobacteriota bacterium]